MYNIICFGEMLWDVLPQKELPGGAPMNVAYHLQKLGMAPAVISRVGKDARGEKLLALLKTNGLTTAYIQEDATHETGVVLAMLNERAEATYDIVSPVAWDFIEYHEDLKKLVAAADFFVFGSLASRTENTRNTLFQLLEQANTKVLDINLRAPHFSKAGVEALLQQCHILKINDQELPLIAGWYGNLKKMEDQMALLQKRFNINTIVTTRGGEGAILKIGDELYQHPGFKVRVSDTVGSGDAFLAALLCKLSQHETPADALEFANGLGAFIASREGACPDYALANVETEIHAGFATSM